MKPRSKPTEWPTMTELTDEREGLLGGVGRLGRLLDVGVGDAVHLVADDRAARVDERRPAVDDLAALDLDRGDLDEVGHLGVGAGRLDVDDDELVAGVDAVREVEDRAGAGLEERRALGLADAPRGARSWMSMSGWSARWPNRIASAMTVLGQELGARLDHHDRVARAGDDQVELRLRELAVGRVDDELAADAADAHGADRARERDLADASAPPTRRSCRARRARSPGRSRGP